MSIRLQHSGRMRWSVFASAAALSALAVSNSAAAGTDPDVAVDTLRTATPIKHVIIIVGENRSFDHLFATYVPKRRDAHIRNLLSEQIINADGTPGPRFAKAHQFQITSEPNGGKFFISADMNSKTLYPTLPPPDVGGVGMVSPYAQILSIPGGDPGLPPQSQFLFATGGTGLSFTLGPDARITNVEHLPPGPFQLTGPAMPYDAFTADTIHQYFQMYQQMDCALDREHLSRDNPTGCLHDLQSAVTTTYSTPPSGTPHDTGQTMAFFNMQDGDAPVLKALADHYNMSDNYHQAVMGGTGPDSEPLGFARPVVLQRRQGQPGYAAGEHYLQPRSAAGNLEPLHETGPVVQLLRPGSAGYRGDLKLLARTPIQGTHRVRRG
jgi:phospholipase C